ncbi:MAG: DUF5615 family PIN-like protein [Phycisphaerae bacterium]|nr:DUF5615 family PIN-like protein [Phycisphaerae bacterium]
MHFLVDANMPKRCNDVIRHAGHVATDVRDVGLGVAEDTEIAAYAARHQLCILTIDFDLANIRDYPPKDYAGIVVLTLPKRATEDVICDILANFLSHMPADLRGCLIVVDKKYFRVRR